MADSEGALVVDACGRRSKRANGVQTVIFRIKSDMYHLGIHSLMVDRFGIQIVPRKPPTFMWPLEPAYGYMPTARCSTSWTEEQWQGYRW